MSKIKEASQFTNGAWSTPTPIGADDANIDITSATTNPTSDTTATSDGLVASDVTVSSGDTDAGAWTKFNRFRKRVQNSFGTLAGKTLATAYTQASDTNKIYSASVLNTYMENVIGYKGTTAPNATFTYNSTYPYTVTSQIGLLNDNLNTLRIAPRHNYSTLDAMKTELISIANSLNSGEMQTFCIEPTFTDNVFEAYNRYSGIICRNPILNTLNFIVNLVSNWGKGVLITYADGIWNFRCYTADIDSLKPLAKVYSNAQYFDGNAGTLTLNNVPAGPYLVIFGFTTSASEANITLKVDNANAWEDGYLNEYIQHNPNPDFCMYEKTFIKVLSQQSNITLSVSSYVYRAYIYALRIQPI